MNPNSTDGVNYELLARYLAGECQPDEQAAVEAWVQAHPDNEQTFQAVKAAWNHAARQDTPDAYNTDAAWTKVRDRISPATGGGRIRPMYRLYAAAAAIILIAVLTLFFVNRTSPEDPRFLTAATGADTLHLHLADGSTVVLAANSKLTYPAAFLPESRSVTLEGEGFFDIERDESRPFLVDAAGAEVKVLGTSFNIRTTDTLVSVVVATGKVAVNAAGKPAERITLTAGQSAKVDRTSNEVAKVAEELKNTDFWNSGELVYQGTPLREVLTEMQLLFGLNIRLNAASPEDCKLSTTFRGNSPEEILEVISTTFNLEIQKHDEYIILSGEGCN